MMYGQIDNGYRETMCGMVIIRRFSKNKICKNYDWIELSPITKQALLDRPGARLLQCGFIQNDRNSDAMFDHLVNELGLTPAYISPVRKNTNSDNMFYTAIFELEERK